MWWHFCDLHVGLSELLQVIALLSKSLVVGVMPLNIASFDRWSHLSFSPWRNHAFFTLLSLNPCCWLVIYILLYARVFHSYFQHIYLVLLWVLPSVLDVTSFIWETLWWLLCPVLVTVCMSVCLYVCVYVCMHRIFH